MFIVNIKMPAPIHDQLMSVHAKLVQRMYEMSLEHKGILIRATLTVASVYRSDIMPHTQAGLVALIKLTYKTYLADRSSARQLKHQLVKNYS